MQSLQQQRGAALRPSKCNLKFISLLGGVTTNDINTLKYLFTFFSSIIYTMHLLIENQHFFPDALSSSEMSGN
jgi:hypothetical protein